MNLNGANFLSCLRKNSLRTDLLSPYDVNDNNDDDDYEFRYIQNALKNDWLKMKMK